MNFEEKWKELLTDEYTDYGDVCETIEQVVEALKEDWGEYGHHGYGLFQDDYTDVLHIERIDELCWYDCDIEAARQAEKDGVKIIHDIEIPEDSNLWYYKDTFIDTPENRSKLLKELEKGA